MTAQATYEALAEIARASILFMTVIWCECKNQAGGLSRETVKDSMYEASHKAIKEGWTVSDGKAICPKCTERLSAEADSTESKDE